MLHIPHKMKGVKNTKYSAALKHNASEFLLWRADLHVQIPNLCAVHRVLSTPGCRSKRKLLPSLRNANAQTTECTQTWNGFFCDVWLKNASANECPRLPLSLQLVIHTVIYKQVMLCKLKLENQEIQIQVN